MGTGLIFAAVIAIWVAYGVPLALRRHEEAARTGSVTTFSNALRVLTHRKDTTETVDVEDADSTSTSKPKSGADVAASTASTAAAPTAAAPTAVAPTAQAAPARRPYNRRAARIAARRRRRVLLVLLTAVAVVSGLAVGGILLPWAPAIPAGLVVVWLVLCRVMVRSEIGRPMRLPRSLSAERRAERRTERMRRRETRRVERAARLAESEDDEALAVDPDSEVTVVLSGQIEDHDPGRRNVMERGPLPDGALDQQVLDAVAVDTTTGTTLWDPVPVTLPTYVSKPAAARTVRTVDFGESPAGEGRKDADDKGAADQPRRAVGD